MESRDDGLLDGLEDEAASAMATALIASVLLLETIAFLILAFNHLVLFR